ncbi:hypothetical protein VSS74_03955 [Conexibacter stalactiti]|uniref:Uncharacterized protein n=1 Tax=Conexibacter stalactiti TaxID=1940611 RepID=A0ABU4HJI5_9ACTN|nr:hypothetical protein [Conexibacter stalactiti]MDW5593477.1 hypothetical protein [Conexibacter stalactiti]MEC5034118.1 hypothetical protein [Conexibacter stalactiti]
MNDSNKSHHPNAVPATPSEAATHHRVRSSVTEEVHRLATDQADREEMRIVREQLADLTPPQSD